MYITLIGIILANAFRNYQNCNVQFEQTSFDLMSKSKINRNLNLFLAVKPFVFSLIMLLSIRNISV